MFSVSEHEDFPQISWFESKKKKTFQTILSFFPEFFYIPGYRKKTFKFLKNIFFYFLFYYREKKIPETHLRNDLLTPLKKNIRILERILYFYGTLERCFSIKNESS